MIVGRAVRSLLVSGADKVTLSFAGVDAVPTSFVNTAFVDLLIDFPLAEIKRRVRIIDSTPAINAMIKRMLEAEAVGRPSAQNPHVP